MKELLCVTFVGTIGSLAFAGQTASNEKDVIEYSCGVIGAEARATSEGRVPLVVRVLQLKKSEPVRLPSGADPAKHAISCARSMLVPSVNDVKILELGFKLFIGASGNSSDELRTAILEGTRPNVVMVMISGKQSDSEVALTKKVLQEINGLD